MLTKWNRMSGTLRIPSARERIREEVDTSLLSHTPSFRKAAPMRASAYTPAITSGPK